MKGGDLVICKRAYNKKGIVVSIKEQLYYSEPICDVWVYELDDEEDKRKIFSFMVSQLEVVNESR